MASKERVTEPTGNRLAANLRALREDRRLSQPQLASRMEALGVAIHASAISKIEQRERRVDVDDLIALAVALDTTPNRLLLPGAANEDDPTELTPEVTVSTLDAWKWATGEEPLPAGFAPPERQMLVRDDRERWFTRENRPHNLAEPYFHNVQHDIADHPGLFRMVAHVVMEARERGVNLGSLVRLVERTDMYRQFGNLEDALNATREPEPPATKPQRPAVITAIVTSPLGVLIGKRNDGKPPWTFIAGENEPGESPADTIVREVKEETGLQITPGDILGERVHPKTGRHMVYVAARPAGRSTRVFVGDEDELAEVRWVGLVEADDLLPGMFEPVREHLAHALGGDR